MSAMERGRLAEYARVTRSGTYGFLAAVPLLVAYEALILLTDAGGPPVRVGADVWIKRLLASIGGTGMFVVGLTVLAVGTAIVIVERRRKLPIRPAWFGWMMVESLVYAVLVALAVSHVVSVLFQAAAPAVDPVLAAARHDPGGLPGSGSWFGPAAAAAVPGESQGLGRLLALSLGAGLYEELVFRVVLVSGLAWVIVRLGGDRKRSYLVAALAGAAAFSAVHYIGAYGDPFTAVSFAFRFLFGLALNGLYLARGFGVAAWTHALYDILVVTRLLV